MEFPDPTTALVLWDILLVLSAGRAVRSLAATSACCAYSILCTSFSGLPYRILIIKLLGPKEGTTLETVGRVEGS